jgi:hypothetical protein
MATAPKQIVDKNGKHTTVHARIDDKSAAKSRPTAPKPSSSSTANVAMSSLDAGKIAQGIDDLNNGGDMLFRPNSIRTHVRGNSYMTVEMTSIDGTIYEAHIQKSSKGQQTVAVWKSYEQADDFLSDEYTPLTSAQPYIKRDFAELRDETYHRSGWESEMVADNIFEMVELLEEGESNWNASVDAAKFMYFGEAFSDINEALRNDSELNPKLIETLDGIMESDTLTAPVTVYRGIRVKDADKRAELQKGFVEKSYLSTSVNLSTAQGFAGGLGRGGLVAKITLPAGTKCHNTSDDAEGEIALGRNFDLGTAEWIVLD